MGTDPGSKVRSGTPPRLGHSTLPVGAADVDTTAPKQMKVTVGVTVGLEAEGTG